MVVMFWSEEDALARGLGWVGLGCPLHSTTSRLGIECSTHSLTIHHRPPFNNINDDKDDNGNGKTSLAMPAPPDDVLLSVCTTLKTPPRPQPQVDTRLTSHSCSPHFATHLPRLDQTARSTARLSTWSMSTRRNLHSRICRWGVAGWGGSIVSSMRNMVGCVRLATCDECGSCGRMNATSAQAQRHGPISRRPVAADYGMLDS
jgi:hypothetical protein